MGQSAPSGAYYRRAVAAHGGEAFMPARLGALLLKAGDLEGAERAFRQATAMDLVNPGIWGDLRDVLVRLGRFDEAMIAARKTLVYAPDPTDALNHLMALEDRQSAP